MSRKPVDTGARGLNALGNLSSINLESRNMNIPLPSQYLYNSTMGSRTVRPTPPPLPPRRNTTLTPGYNRMSPMSSMYSPYSRFPSGMYSPTCGGFAGYRMNNYGGFMAPNDGNNSFVQMAEESTRPAFESIESVVEVVSSISMMLESTYHAVYSSYSAILGVVDQFSRLKDHLAQIFSILALLRGLRWLCLKVLHLLGLKKDNPTVEAAWNSAEQISSGIQIPDFPEEARTSAWPFLMFIGLVVGAPWLMFKLLSKSVLKKTFDTAMFVDESGRAYVACAAFDFTATQNTELSFKAGDRLYIAPKSAVNSKGWVFAVNNKQETGFVPQNYLSPKPIPNGQNPPPPPQWMIDHLNAKRNSGPVPVQMPVPLPGPVNDPLDFSHTSLNGVIQSGALDAIPGLDEKDPRVQLPRQIEAEMAASRFNIPNKPPAVNGSEG